MGKATNCIFIEGLEVQASVGIYDHEKEDLQSLIITMDAECLRDKNFHSDDIDDTLNYEKIIKIIHATIEKQHYNLIETLAEKIASDVLGISDIHAATIEIRKPSVLASSSKGILGIRIKRTK